MGASPSDTKKLSVFSAELTPAEEHLALAIAGGSSIKNAAADQGLTEKMLSLRRLRKPCLDQAIRQACAIKQLSLIDGAREILDAEPDTNRAKLTWDVLKWTAGKFDPQQFGERMDINLTATVDIGAALAEARNRVTVRPMCDLDDAIDGEFEALPHDQPAETIAKESTGPAIPDIFS